MILAQGGRRMNNRVAGLDAFGGSGCLRPLLEPQRPPPEGGLIVLADTSTPGRPSLGDHKATVGNEGFGRRGAGLEIDGRRSSRCAASSWGIHQLPGFHFKRGDVVGFTAPRRDLSTRAAKRRSGKASTAHWPPDKNNPADYHFPHARHRLKPLGQLHTEELEAAGHGLRRRVVGVRKRRISEALSDHPIKGGADRQLSRSTLRWLLRCHGGIEGGLAGEAGRVPKEAKSSWLIAPCQKRSCAAVRTRSGCGRTPPQPGATWALSFVSRGS